MSTRTHWWERLNRALFPYFGPAQLGPGPDGERATVERTRTCPICGAPMSEHEILRTADSHHATRLVCP